MTIRQVVPAYIGCHQFQLYRISDILRDPIVVLLLPVHHNHTFFIILFDSMMMIFGGRFFDHFNDVLVAGLISCLVER